MVPFRGVNEAILIFDVVDEVSFIRLYRWSFLAEIEVRVELQRLQIVCNHVLVALFGFFARLDWLVVC